MHLICIYSVGDIFHSILLVLVLVNSYPFKNFFAISEWQASRAVAKGAYDRLSCPKPNLQSKKQILEKRQNFATFGRSFKFFLHFSSHVLLHLTHS